MDCSACSVSHGCVLEGVFCVSSVAKKVTFLVTSNRTLLHTRAQIGEATSAFVSETGKIAAASFSHRFAGRLSPAVMDAGCNVMADRARESDCGCDCGCCDCWGCCCCSTAAAAAAAGSGRVCVCGYSGTGPTKIPAMLLDPTLTSVGVPRAQSADRLNRPSWRGLPASLRPNSGIGAVLASAAAPPD
eukprot:SAG31_NODE_115_length_24128_cov_47.693912_2_plen_188_part_00